MESIKKNIFGKRHGIVPNSAAHSFKTVSKNHILAWGSFLLGMQDVLGFGYLQSILMVAMMHLQKKIIKVRSALAVAVSKVMVLIG
uniref:hypothetical protein n=1 Tax=Flavobacterium sp. TaxID=239 RepID=UPI004049A551